MVCEEEVRAEKEEQNIWNTRLVAGPLLCRQGDWRGGAGRGCVCVCGGDAVDRWEAMEAQEKMGWNPFIQ